MMLDETTMAAVLLAAAIFPLCAASDVVNGKIPNFLTAPTFLLALGLQISVACRTGTVFEIGCRTVVCLFFFLVIGPLGVAGMGDLKLLMMSTMLLGVVPTAVAAIGAAIILLIERPMDSKIALYLLPQEVYLAFREKRKLYIDKERSVPFALYYGMGMFFGLMQFVVSH